MKKSAKFGIGLGVGIVSAGAMYGLYEHHKGPDPEIMQIDGAYYEVECDDYREWTVDGGPNESKRLVEDFVAIDSPSDISEASRGEVVTYVVDFQNGHDKSTRFIMEQYFLPETCEIRPLEDYSR